MATCINHMYFFIAILCIASVLTLGGAMNVKLTPYCVSIGPCSDKTCGDSCLQQRFYLGSRCISEDVCCCNVGKDMYLLHK
ncbi:hypothetical protein P8452_70879 [Trifolium repens]|nr:hypothetical protein P8452_70879 [Trifolium repens]